MGTVSLEKLTCLKDSSPSNSSNLRAYACYFAGHPLADCGWTQSIFLRYLIPWELGWVSCPGCLSLNLLYFSYTLGHDVCREQSNTFILVGGSTLILQLCCLVSSVSLFLPFFFFWGFLSSGHNGLWPI